MKGIKAKVTILFNHEGLTIDVMDADYNVTFLSLELDAIQSVKALSRLGHVPCTKAVVNNLDLVGKVMEHKVMEFLVSRRKGDQLGLDLKQAKMKSIAKQKCPKGWVPDLYFNAVNSTFYKGNELWARCTIRRWIDKNPKESNNEEGVSV